KRKTHKDAGISLHNVKRHHRKKPSQEESPRQAKYDAQEREPEPSAKHKLQYVPPLRTQRDTHAYLVGTLRHRESHQTVDAYHGQEQGKRPERDNESCIKSALGDRV